jgi:uncharacterized membrane protein
MKNLLSGLVVFIAHIGIIFFSTKIIQDVNVAPLWLSVLFGLITIFYIYFGYQTSKKENHGLAGGIFYILALITAFLIIMLNATY